MGELQKKNVHYSAGHYAEMEKIHSEFSSIDEVNLAELGRRTGLSRSKLRRLKANGLNGQKKERILDGYSSVQDTLLKSGVSNSTVCLERLQAMGDFPAVKAQ